MSHVSPAKTTAGFTFGCVLVLDGASGTAFGLRPCQRRFCLGDPHNGIRHRLLLFVSRA